MAAIISTCHDYISVDDALDEHIKKIRRDMKSLIMSPNIPKPESQPPKRNLHFFDLPAELRNRIYTYAVVTPNGNDEIIINRNTHMQPSLLRASRQLRFEASPIFYFDNTFRFSCPDFDCTALLSFSQHYRMYWNAARAGKFKYDVPGQPRSWRNLERWLKLTHERKIPALNRVSAQDNMSGRSLAARAMAVVRELRDLPWERVRLILEQLRLSNSQWV